jgi:hypothetical protein
MDKTLLGLLMIFFLAFTIFMTFIIFNDQLTTVTRASTDIVSADKSLIFAWPLTLKADGKTESEITIFVRNDEGKGISDKFVKLTSSVGEVKEPSVSTDKAGKAIFHLSSSKVGIAELETLVDNNPIRKKVSIKFE